MLDLASSWTTSENSYT